MPPIDDEERRLFRDAMRGVREIASADPEPQPPRRSEPRRDAPAMETILARQVQNADDPDEPSHRAYMAPGVQRRLFLRLRRGTIPIDAELDLHGLRTEQARKALHGILKNRLEERHTCIRIVHGQGHHSPGGNSVLRKLLPGWLRSHPHVLAFAPAPRGSGSAGALHVLLRTSGTERAR